MRHDDKSASFLSRWRLLRPADAASDPADYGTAWGLDLSMAEGVPQPAEALPAAVVAPVGDSWLARWRRRA